MVAIPMETNARMHGVAQSKTLRTCVAKGCNKIVEGRWTLCKRCQEAKDYSPVPQAAYRTDKYGRRIA